MSMRISMRMTPIEHIRKNVLKLSQSAFADLAGTTQPTVSRWENGSLEPNREEMARIREKAVEIGAWDDRWFFEAPPQPHPESAA